MSYANQSSLSSDNSEAATSVAPKEKTITGIVVDKGGIPVIGASIIFKGTSIGTTTDVDGKFSLTSPNDDAILKISYIGMKSQEIIVGDKSFFKIELEDDAIAIDEVVAIGYVTRKKGELTGSVSTIKSEDIMRSSNSNVAKSLEGKVSGLIVKDNGGYPGDNDVTMLIRGKSTLNNNSPLIVIDGVPGGSLSYLAPSDIESITILKDAAAAIYGARAANGVIVVTTLRGKDGKPRVNISSSYKMSAFTRIPTMMNSTQYTTYADEIAARNGFPLPFSTDDIAKYAAGNDPINYPNTDWYGSTMKDYSSEWRNSVSVSGGNETVKYFIGGDFLHDNGLYKSGDLNFDQKQIRSNIDVKLNKYLKLGVDLSVVNGLQNQPGAAKSDINKQLTVNSPTAVAVYPNGLLGTGSENGSNPVILSSADAGFNKIKNKQVKSRFTLDLDLGWLTEGLSLKGTAAFSTGVTDGKIFLNTWKAYNYNPTTSNYDVVPGYFSQKGNFTSLSDSYSEDTENYYSGQLNYNKSFGDHTIHSFVAFEQVSDNNRSFEAYRMNIISANSTELFAGSTTGMTNNGTATEMGRVNYFGSIGYDFQRKYMIDFTLRRDGSGNFAPGLRFGTFPGVSAGWVVSKESFMDATKTWLDVFKLRASWAQMGNDRIAAFQYLNNYVYGVAATNQDRYRDFYIFGETPVVTNTFKTLVDANSVVTWERAESENIGLNFTMFKNRLSGDANFYMQNRKDILVRRTAGIPDYTGLKLPNENLGRVKTWGYEFELNYNDKIGDLEYNIGVNFTNTNSKIINIDEAANVPDYQKQEGHPIDSYLIYPTDGIFKDQAEVDATTAKLTGTKPGDIKYIDTNDDGKISDLDQIRKFTSAIPTIQYGITTGLKYKGIEVNALFQGQANSEIKILFDNNGNRPAYQFEQRWTPENPDAKYPRAFGAADIYNDKLSDIWLEDASFIRLKELEIAYSLPKNTFSFANVKIMLKGSNLFTFDNLSKLKGFDPEVTAYGAFSEGLYQPVKSATIGLNIQF